MSARSRTRLSYIDWARGIAVLLMIEAHTLDAWTRAADRHSLAFRNATVLGGFAAPLFLWLAGLASVLSAVRTAQKTGSRAAAVDAICRRGVEIFILAFLFRLQAFILSPGSHPVTIFRVDILNIMGPAIAVCGLVWGAARSARAQVVAFTLLAAALAMVTPIVRDAAAVDALPTWFQWYIRPAGELTMFTVFPWAAFVFAGGACGAAIAAAQEAWDARRLQTIIAAAGVALVAGGFYTASLPSIYTHASFWTTSPTWFAIRVGILMIALPTLFALERGNHHLSAIAGRLKPATTATTMTARLKRATTVTALKPASTVTELPAATVSRVDPLARFGQSSLFVYWIHVELVYGYASWLWRGRLPLLATAVAWAAFCVLMYGAIVLRDRVWKRGRIVGADTWGAALGAGPQGVT